MRAATESADDETSPIFDLDALAATPKTPDLVGREISTRDVRVKQVANHGFWVSAENGARVVFVVPAEGSLIIVRPGEVVSLNGEVRLTATTQHNKSDVNSEPEGVMPYVYAYTVRPAW